MFSERHQVGRGRRSGIKQSEQRQNRAKASHDEAEGRLAKEPGRLRIKAYNIVGPIRISLLSFHI